MFLKLGKYDEVIAIYDKVQSLSVYDFGAFVHLEASKALAIDGLTKPGYKILV